MKLNHNKIICIKLVHLLYLSNYYTLIHKLRAEFRENQPITPKYYKTTYNHTQTNNMPTQNIDKK